MRLQACGENPQAADSVGINVTRVRYAGVIISGFLCGIGGLMYIIPNSTEYSADVAGYGYLAYALLIFGQWCPNRIFFASILFGLLRTFSFLNTGKPFLVNKGVSSYRF
jgi:simple sugar transport system permease protein